MKHFKTCRNNVGGKERIEQMLKLVEYLENRDWMKIRCSHHEGARMAGT